MSDFYQQQSPVTGALHDPNDGPRYTSLATFMRTPIARNLETLDIVLAGVPYDGGVTNRAGARHGPRAMRDASTMMRAIHHVSRINPYELANIADVGDVPLQGVFDHEVVIRDIESFYRKLVESDVIPLSAGGDHSVTYPILKAVAAEGPVALIHIDAHTDTWDEFSGSKFMHVLPFDALVRTA